MVQYHHHLVTSVDDTWVKLCCLLTLWLLNIVLSVYLCALPYLVGPFSSFRLAALCPFCWLALSWGCGWDVPEAAAADDSDFLPELALVCGLRSWKVKAHKNTMQKAHHQDSHVYCYNNFEGVCQKRHVPNIILYTPFCGLRHFTVIAFS